MALPPGITPKTVTLGIASFADGSLASGRATISLNVNVIHTPTNRPIFSSEMTKPFVDGEVSFDLLPTDAPGLNRVDWSYKLKVEIQGANVQPEVIYFLLPTAGPDTVDLDGLVTVPSSAGIPISVDVLTAADVDPTLASVITPGGSATAAALAADPALRAALVPRPSGGTDGQALVKSGTEIVWGAGGGGGGSGITPGTTAGQVPVWDGDSWEPATPAAVTATDLAFTPTGTVAATTVQAAITEVASEAIPTSQKGANNGVATLDASGQVPASQLGNATGGGGGTDPDAWIGYAATLLAAQSSASLITAGRIFFARVTRGSKTGATKIGMQIATASGNVMVGVYSATGSGTAALPGALKGSSLVVVCPAAGYSEVTLQAATDIARGDFLALWCDNITATFGYLGNSAASNKSIACYNDAGTGITAMPASLAAGVISGFNRHYMLTGV